MQCEQHNWEVSGKFYELYAEMMLWGDEVGDEFCYHTYYLVSQCKGTVCHTIISC